MYEMNEVYEVGAKCPECQQLKQYIDELEDSIQHMTWDYEDLDTKYTSLLNDMAILEDNLKDLKEYMFPNLKGMIQTIENMVYQIEIT